MNHTPGPWMATKINVDVHAFSVTCVKDPIGTKSLDVCAVWMRGGIVKAEANANLIAAAPELLELLIQVVKEFDTYDNCEEIESTSSLRNKARAAIAKATGKSPGQ